MNVKNPGGGVTFSGRQWSARARGDGYAPGTFGELVQGELDGITFMITLPITLGSHARFTRENEPGVRVVTPGKEKARQAAWEVCRYLGIPGGHLSLSSTLPIGKGMASSSADVVASIRAVASAAGKRLGPGQIGHLAAQVEPTDGIMYPGLVVFDPIRGVLLERLGPVPRLSVMGTLGQGRVNTVKFHHEALPYSKEEQRAIREALKWARRGGADADAHAIGKAGRISASVHLQRIRDPLLQDMLPEAEARDWGLMIGHSGTVRGFLVASARLDDEAAAMQEFFARHGVTDWLRFDILTTHPLRTASKPPLS